MIVFLACFQIPTKYDSNTEVSDFARNFCNFFALKLGRIALKSRCLSLFYGEKLEKRWLENFVAKHHLVNSM